MSDEEVGLGAEPEVTYRVEGSTAVVTLNRPDRLNAWVPAMDAQLRGALTQAANDRGVVGIVLTGAGRAFCAGADMNVLDDVSERNPDLNELGDAADRLGDFGGRFTYLFDVPKPIVAAIHGPVAGMAVALALCSDVRVVTPGAMFISAFAHRGLIAEWGMSWVLPRLIGPAATLDLLWTSRRVSGDEAYRLGLANYIVEPSELLSFSIDYVEGIGRQSAPISLAVMKRQVYQQIHRGLGEAELESVALMQDSFQRPDFTEGVRAFIEKRPPQFERWPATPPS